MYDGIRSGIRYNMNEWMNQHFFFSLRYLKRNQREKNQRMNYNETIRCNDAENGETEI